MTNITCCRCPQRIAKRGKYGSFLMEEFELVYNIINKGMFKLTDFVTFLSS